MHFSIKGSDVQKQRSSSTVFAALALQHEVGPNYAKELADASTELCRLHATDCAAKTQRDADATLS